MTESEGGSTFSQRLDLLKAGELHSLDEVLRPFTVTENFIRRDLRLRLSSDLLPTPFSRLVDVYDAPEFSRTALGEAPIGNVFPLPPHLRLNPGEPCMTKDINTFQEYWRDHTRGVLDELDWENIVAAGGAVHACLSFGKNGPAESREAWLESDIDIFPCGLGSDEIEIKVGQILEMLDRKFPGQVHVERSCFTVTFKLPAPFRTIQVVLKPLPSPAAVLCSFDLDISCFLYDGKRVYATPNAMGCMMRQCVVVDVARYTPTFELRLAKYVGRGYEVHVPLLDRARVDNNIFRVSLVRLRGLALLLALENVMSKQSLGDNQSILRRLGPIHAYDYAGSVFRGNTRKVVIGKVVDLAEMELLTRDNPNTGAIDTALWYATAYRAINN